MKIFMVGSESQPFIKTGGLADVIYSLSKEIVKEGHDVSIFLPLYQNVKGLSGLTKITTLTVEVFRSIQEAEILLKEYDNIKFYFVKNDYYFKRDRCYGFDDDHERFAFFTLACKQFIFSLKKMPDIIHLHDWHVGMLPCLMKEDYFENKKLKNTKFVYTIHNPAFQGMIEPHFMLELYHLPEHLFTDGALRFKEQGSTLKAGIIYADKITTVSPNHHYELLTQEGSMGLDGVLRLREYDFSGILNGIDYDEFNPHTDPCLPLHYNSTNYFRTKVEIKRKLFEQLKIFDYGKPTYSIISRLTWQKGMDITYGVLEALLELKCNVLVLGSGEYNYEQMMEDLRRRFPKQMAIYIGYNDELAHQIYASSDYILIPSLFEPCGLTQMIGHRYGAMPIVRETGGLKDSVIPYNGENLEEANGFSFANYRFEDFKKVCLESFDFWFEFDKRKRLMRNAMHADHSWKTSAQAYLSLYSQLIRK